MLLQPWALGLLGFQNTLTSTSVGSPAKGPNPWNNLLLLCK